MAYRVVLTEKTGTAPAVFTTVYRGGWLTPEKWNELSEEYRTPWHGQIGPNSDALRRATDLNGREISAFRENTPEDVVQITLVNCEAQEMVLPGTMSRAEAGVKAGEVQELGLKVHLKVVEVHPEYWKYA